MSHCSHQQLFATSCHACEQCEGFVQGDLCESVTGALNSAGRGGACASVRCSSLPARSLLRIHIPDVRPACSACREAPHHPRPLGPSQEDLFLARVWRSASAVRHDSVEVVHGDISSSRPATSSSQASSAPQPPPLPPTPVHSAHTHTDETDLVPRIAAMQRVPTESVQRVQRTGRVYDVDEEDGFTFQTCVAGFSTSPPSPQPPPPPPPLHMHHVAKSFAEMLTHRTHASSSADRGLRCPSTGMVRVRARER